MEAKKNIFALLPPKSKQCTNINMLLRRRAKRLWLLPRKTDVTCNDKQTIIRSQFCYCFNCVCHFLFLALALHQPRKEKIILGAHDTIMQ